MTAHLLDLPALCPGSRAEAGRDGTQGAGAAHGRAEEGEEAGRWRSEAGRGGAGAWLRAPAFAHAK